MADGFLVAKAKPTTGYTVGPLNPIHPRNVVLLVAATTRSLERFIGEEALAKAPAAVRPLLRFLYQQAATGEKRAGRNGEPPTTHSGTNILVSSAPGAMWDGKGPLNSPKSWNLSKLPISASIGVNLEEAIRFARSPAGQTALGWMEAQGGSGGKALAARLRTLSAPDHVKSGLETWAGGRVRLGINLDLTPMVPGLANFGRFDKLFAGISPGIFAPLGGALGDPKPGQSPGFYWYVGARNGALASPDKPAGDPATQGNALNVAFIISSDRNAALEGAVGSQLTFQFSRTRSGQIYFKLPDRDVYVQLPAAQAKILAPILGGANVPGSVLNQKPIDPPPASKIMSFDRFTNEVAHRISQAANHPAVQNGIRIWNSEAARSSRSIAQTAASVQPAVGAIAGKAGLGAVGGAALGGVTTYVGNEVFNTASTADLNGRTYPRASIDRSQQATPEFWKEKLSRRYGGNPVRGPHLRNDQLAATANLAAVAYRKLAGDLAARNQPPQRAEEWIYEKAGGGVAGMVELLWTPYNNLPALDPNFRKKGVTADSFKSIGMTKSESWSANNAYLLLRNRTMPATQQNYSPQESYAVVLEKYLYGKAWRGPITGGEAALRELNQSLGRSTEPLRPVRVP